MRTIDLRAGLPATRELAAILPRAKFDIAAACEQAAPLISDVRARGEEAILDQAERFDRCRPVSVRVPAELIAAAPAALDPPVLDALTEAIRRVRAVHTDQRPRDSVTTLEPGARVVQRWIPVSRVGLYVPGGLVVYPSSVVMNAVAAQCAGVEAIALASPPQASASGWPHPTVLAACALLGIDEVYAAGGAGAIALLAYGASAAGGGTLSEPVDVVTGPGNVWVAAAKRLVRGDVGIDAEAGPTEIAVLADADADPNLVAADLLSQAEHDPLAACVLVTDAPELWAAVEPRLEARAAATKHAERVATALAGEQSATVLTASLDDSIAVANAYGAEHLEIQTAEPTAVAARIRNAGAIFVGPGSPVPLGDYLAGSNHVLPTGGTARRASGLGVMSFLKSVQQIEYTPSALARVADAIRALAVAEDLPAHGESVAARHETPQDA